jgi:hypothetical protein
MKNEEESVKQTGFLNHQFSLDVENQEQAPLL